MSTISFSVNNPDIAISIYKYEKMDRNAKLINILLLIFAIYVYL